jgi:anti-sigma regulatory factor (Ser/Thr protein kinase)
VPAASGGAARAWAPAPARPGGGGLTAELALLGTLTIPGRPEFVGASRRFVARTLRGRCPCADTAVLLTSELVGNSLQYSNSRRPGGVITVTVVAVPDGVRTEVADHGGATDPVAGAPPGDLLAEGGRGLVLVDLLAARWNFCRERTATITWFELACPAS